MKTYQAEIARDAQLDALGDSTRRAILARLLEGELPVGRLALEFPISRPAVSQHLRVLKRAGLVADRAVGNRRFYRLDPAGFDSLRAYFDQYWSRALDAFRAKVEESPEEEEK